MWRIHRRIGMSGGLFVNALMRETGRDAVAEDILQLQDGHARRYLALPGQVTALPGATRLLQHLTNVRIPWAIATSGVAEPPARAGAARDPEPPRS